MKKLLLLAAIAAMAFGANADGYKLEKVWELSTATVYNQTGVNILNVRQGFGMNGKFYFNDKNTAEGAIPTIYEVDENGFTGVTFEGGRNCGITRDEAGNIIVSDATFPGGWVQATIKVINPTTGEIKVYTIPEECGMQGRCDFLGFPKGNLMEDGVLYLTGKTSADVYTDGVAIFTVEGGEVNFDECYLATNDVISPATQRDNMTIVNYYEDLNGDPALLYVYRSVGINVRKLTFDGSDLICTTFSLPNKGACNGTFPFIWDGMELFVSEMSGEPVPGRIRIEADPAQKDARPQDQDRATVTIECQGGSEGCFIFRENRIVFEAEDRSERAMPTKVTVNDTLWPDLDSSRMLGFMPDLRTAEILEESGPGTVSHTRLTGPLKLYFNNRSTMRNAPPVRFTISEAKKAPSEKPDDRFNVTLRAKLAGNIAGFRFQGSRILYYPIFGEAPSDVTVNGKLWEDLDKPFELDFVTNPAAAEILEKSAGPLTPSKYSDGFVVRLGGRLWTGNSQFVAKLNDESEATTEKPAGQETISLEMRLQGSARLRFRDDKLYFTLFSGAYPNSGITVNGKHWDDPETPFELGFVPDFGSMTILDRRGPTVELTPGKDKAELLLNSHGALNTFQVELAVKKRTDAVPGSAPVNTQTAATRGVDSDVRLPAGPQFGPFGFAGSSNAGIRSDTIIFEVMTETQCMFTFEEDTLECRELTSPGVHSDGPTITLNGRILRDFAKPVYLGFVPDYEHAEVSVTYRARSRVVRVPWMPVNVKREGKKMIVTTLDMDDRSLLESSSYSVRIVLKKPGTSDTAKPGAAAAAKAQDGRFADEGELRQWNMMMQGIVEAMEGGVRLRHMTFDADISGTGTFVIHGDEIHYRHEPGQPLPDVTINGTHWDDLDEPFVLAFVPQLYSEAVSYQFDADSAVASYPFSPISMVWDGGKLMVSTRAIPDGKGGNCHYRVRFNLPEINVGRVGGFSTQRPARTQSNSNGQKPAGETAKPDAEEEVRVVIEGIFEFRETLEFHGNTISYATHANRTPERMFGRERPWIAINGKEWTDLAKPFVLDFTPDYTVRGKLVETQGRTNPMLSPMAQGAKLEFNDYQDDGDYYKLVISFRKSKP